MSVSDREIQREIDNLRSFRRRSASSAGPGATALDPDLPPTSPPSPKGQTAPSQHYGSPPSPSRSGSQASVFNRDRSASIENLSGRLQNASLTNSDDDRVIGGGPAGGAEDRDENGQQFWVPARLHPELAPSEFRAFLKTHSHTDPDGVVDGVGEATGALAGTVGHAGGSGPGLARSPSWLARSGQGANGNLGRKRSMLSRQYQPKPNDGVESEPPPLPFESARLTRSASGKSSIYGGVHGDQGVTLEELQKLENLVEGAGLDADPTQMRNLLRSSLSLRSSSQSPDELMESNENESDSPIIAARPGQILRRNARTRIRKPGLPGDGGGHRFGSSRKSRVVSGTPSDDQYADDYSSGGLAEHHRQRLLDEEPVRRGSKSSDDSDDMYSAESGPGYEEVLDPMTDRRVSPDSTEESAIYDSYVDQSATTSVESSTASTGETGDSFDYSGSSSHHTSSEEKHLESDWDDHHRTPTQPVYHDVNREAILGPTPSRAQKSPPSSPETIRDRDIATPRTIQQNAYASPPVNHHAHAPGPVHTKALEAVKLEAPPVPKIVKPQPSSESLKTGKEEEKKKRGGFFSSKKDKDKEKTKKEGKKEKEGFLGTLFGHKKKQDEPAPLKFSSAGPAAAAALLGSSKSAKSLGLFPLNGAQSPTSPRFNQYARYPIHVERAIYRLSHIKLANPRRPLYEQVLISNLMFWYLGIINKPATPPTPATEEKKPVAVAEAPKENQPEKLSSSPSASEKTPAHRPSGTRSSTTNQSSAGRSGSSNPVAAPVAELTPQQRGVLVKPEQNRARPAETPVRTPQYGMQTIQMQQEYGHQRSSSGSSQRSVSMPPSVTSPSSPSNSRRPPLTNTATNSHPPEVMTRNGLPRSSRSPDLPQISTQSASSPASHRDGPPQLRVVTDHNLTSPHQRSAERSPNKMDGPYSPHRQDGVNHRERRGSTESDKIRTPQSGIQPGQIFHHPGAHAQPGQTFAAQRTSPGQPVGTIFSHPGYQTSPQQVHHSSPANHYHDTHLPPGAMPPRSTQQQQQWRTAPPPQPRPMNPYDYDSPSRSHSADYGPNGQSPHYPAHGQPGRSPSQIRDEQAYNPYSRQPIPSNGGVYGGERR